MNAFVMKLESRFASTPPSRDKEKEAISDKKCKTARKKSVPGTTDKDVSQSDHGLGRKSTKANVLSFDASSIKFLSDLKNKSKQVGGCKGEDPIQGKSEKLQERLKQTLSPEVKEKISSLLNEIRTLSDVEKLFLYLQLPTGSAYEVDPLKQRNLNPLGKKADEEGTVAITWIKSHLEEDPDVSLPKQEVYDEYQSYCQIVGMEPLCAADFGKVMKQIFPSVKPRRLGTRGNSRYCYSGLRKKMELQSPVLPDLNTEKENYTTIEEDANDEVRTAACHLVYEWSEKLLGTRFNTLKDLAAHLLENMYVDNRSVAAFTVMLATSPDFLEKGAQGSIIKTEGGVKKTETQLHLQRKLQEKELIKEQKKKLQQQRLYLTGMSKGKVVPSKRKSSKSKKARVLNMPASDINSDKIPEGYTQSSSNEIHAEIILPDIKSPEKQAKQKNNKSTSSSRKNSLQHAPFEMISDSPEKKNNPHLSPASNSEIDDCVKRKILISKNKTPVCIAQSLPGIIIVPSLPQVQLPDLGPKQNVMPPKYKRIQPKPLRNESFQVVSRSRAGSLGSAITGKNRTRANDGRRSSHAWLQSDSGQESEGSAFKPSSGIGTNLQIVALKAVDVQAKGSESSSILLPKDTSANVNKSKEESNSASDSNNSQPSSLETLLSQAADEKSKCVKIERLQSLEIEKHLENLEVVADDSTKTKRPSDEVENHTAIKRPHLEKCSTKDVKSNQPLLRSKETSYCNIAFNSVVQNSVKTKHQSSTLGGEDEVSVHDIEGDALNDYVRSNADLSPFNLQSNDEQAKELENRQASCNKVQQLSQLRMLLEKNLPKNMPKTTIAKYSTSGENSVIISAQPTVETSNKNNFSSGLYGANKLLLMNDSFKGEVTSQSACPNSETKKLLHNYSQINSTGNLFSVDELTDQLNINVGNALASDSNLFLDVKDEPELDINSIQNSEINDMIPSSNMVPELELPHHISCERVNTYTQVPSVPQSPNTRRRAFNFMPISPRNTPVPEGMNAVGTPASSSPILHLYPRNMVSAAVGPSQPPSNAGSPFVSPRSTPVPPCRSRHSSGQSTYSASRHTPFQNFDSGVSSVSTSPFISPQPTPLPVSRLRHNSSHSISKTVTFSSTNNPQIIHSQLSLNGVGQIRSRHSSGPGGPLHTVGVLYSSRSAPLSPLVNDNSSNFVFGNDARSRHNSGSNTTSLSPVSEQPSPSSSTTRNFSDFPGVIDNSLLSRSFLNDNAADLLISADPANIRQVRQRHASSSVIYNKPTKCLRDPLAQEVNSLLKSSSLNGSPELLIGNRSHSVPLHQMLQNLDTYYLLSQSLEDPCSKSQPTTPVTSQTFTFPLLSSGQDTTTLASATGNNLIGNKTLTQASNMEWNNLEESAEPETSSSRRNLSMLLDGPLSDDLQTTLEDLRDCDTDFSKFAQELEQLNQNDEGSL